MDPAPNVFTGFVCESQLAAKGSDAGFHPAPWQCHRGYQNRKNHIAYAGGITGSFSGLSVKQLTQKNLTHKLNFDKNTHHIINFKRGIMTESENIDIPHLRAYIERHYEDIANSANAGWAKNSKTSFGLPDIDYNNPTLENAKAFTPHQIAALVEHSLLTIKTRTIIEDAIAATGLTDPKALGDYLRQGIVSDLEKLNKFLENRQLDEIDYGFNVQGTSIFLAISPTGSNAIHYSQTDLIENQSRKNLAINN